VIAHTIRPFEPAQEGTMNAASRLILDVARQDLADKLARADRRAQRREAANGHRADSG
jgi:hypothetical protein